MNKPVFYILFGLWLCCGLHLTGQVNLVPNGSFEEYSQCPQGNELNNGQFERAVGWWRPTLGTPDYFHRCNNSLGGVVGVPDNFWGHQEAFHGDGYVGLVPIELTTQNDFIGSEYIQTKLRLSLKPCYWYSFTMYLSLAEFSTHSIERLGAVFSVDTSFNDYTNMNIISVVPNVINTDGHLSDTTNWMKIEGSFIASGSEEFLTIGYFFDDITNDSNRIQFFPLAPNIIAPYYYIDDVSLFEIGEADANSCEFFSINLPNVFTPNSDGINDVIDISSQIKFIKSVDILNRWGGIVATLNENNTIWDGANCPEGVYYYLLNYKYFDLQQTGFIHLIR